MSDYIYAIEAKEVNKTFIKKNKKILALQDFNIQIKKWSQNKIIKMLKKTYNTEIEIKSNSTVNKNILIKKLLLDICNFANAS